MANLTTVKSTTIKSMKYNDKWQSSTTFYSNVRFTTIEKIKYAEQPDSYSPAIPLLLVLTLPFLTILRFYCKHTHDWIIVHPHLSVYH